MLLILACNQEADSRRIASPNLNGKGWTLRCASVIKAKEGTKIDSICALPEKSAGRNIPWLILYSQSCPKTNNSQRQCKQRKT
jgi:hypothetical protein